MLTESLILSSILRAARVHREIKENPKRIDVRMRSDVTFMSDLRVSSWLSGFDRKSGSRV
jgi:hypothetical protein